MGVFNILECIKEIAESVDIPVIASGGVSSLDDIRNLMDIKELYGVITGKAIYTGAIYLKEALHYTLCTLYYSLKIPIARIKTFS